MKEITMEEEERNHSRKRKKMINFHLRQVPKLQLNKIAIKR